MKAEDTYLGDGVYASIDALGQIKLRAPREFGDHVVYLNQDNLNELVKYIHQVTNILIQDLIK